MADAQGDWSASANDAITISLVVPERGNSRTLSSFKPKFTYPIFGDEESVFGYQGLKISLKHNACDMRPCAQITYDKKFRTVGDTVPTDVKALLEDFLPSSAFAKAGAFDATINQEQGNTWCPPGELIRSIECSSGTYEVWKGSLGDKAVQQFMRRIQILVPFFIEGGTVLDLDEPEWSLRRWMVFLLFKKEVDLSRPSSPYIFVGFCTVYRYYLYQRRAASKVTDGLSPTDTEIVPGVSNFDVAALPCRMRISQFMILPPFQQGGNGAALYTSVFEHYLKSAQTIEITVEDPNEAFDDLRDLNDLARLRSVPTFVDLKINGEVKIRRKGSVPTTEIIDVKTLEGIRGDVKIAPRQFSRLVEMHLLSKIPTSVRQSLLHERIDPTSDLTAKKHEYHLWKLFVKQRLYRHNKQSLMQLERQERIDRLEDALSSVEADYARLLRAVDSKQRLRSSNGKRTISPTDAGNPSSSSSSSSKRARIGT